MNAHVYVTHDRFIVEYECVLGTIDLPLDKVNMLSVLLTREREDEGVTIALAEHSATEAVVLKLDEDDTAKIRRDVASLDKASAVVFYYMEPGRMTHTSAFVSYVAPNESCMRQGPVANKSSTPMPKELFMMLCRRRQFFPQPESRST